MRESGQKATGSQLFLRYRRQFLRLYEAQGNWTTEKLLASDEPSETVHLLCYIWDFEFLWPIGGMDRDKAILVYAIWAWRLHRRAAMRAGVAPYAMYIDLFLDDYKDAGFLMPRICFCSVPNQMISVRGSKRPGDFERYVRRLLRDIRLRDRLVFEWSCSRDTGRRIVIDFEPLPGESRVLAPSGLHDGTP